MIIQVKAEAVNMPCDQYAEILDIKIQGTVVDFEIKLLSTFAECEVKPWDIVGVKLSHEFTLKIKWNGYCFTGDQFHDSRFHKECM